ncbi:hypothetical protein HYC85_003147 [Camellia sinensis]|uniref:Uncharacterized protein n=1 Tax=Camellia sinensis TaxID=4442 RepID=A0A7J7ICL4_CAMSI|nr:hypothetical protein HYC85_003147 [Camellia sinensis]
MVSSSSTRRGLVVEVRGRLLGRDDEGWAVGSATTASCVWSACGRAKSCLSKEFTKGRLNGKTETGLYNGYDVERDEARFFPGNALTVVTGAIPTRIIFLTALETTRAATFRLVEPFKLSEPTQAAIANGVAGMAAAVCSQAVFVPIDVVSQKLMVQGYSGHATYNGGLDVASKVLKVDGIRGLYRGFGLSVMTYSPSSAVWFLGHGSTEHEESAPSPWTIVSVQAAGGIFAGATASCITTPLDTIKTRLQNDEIAKTFVDLIIVNYWIGKFKLMSYPLFSGYNHAQSI